MMESIWETVSRVGSDVTERLRVAEGYLYRSAWLHAPALGAAPVEGSAMHYVPGPVEPPSVIVDAAKAAADARAAAIKDAEAAAAAEVEQKRAEAAAALAVQKAAETERQHAQERLDAVKAADQQAAPAANA